MNEFIIGGHFRGNSHAGKVPLQNRQERVRGQEGASAERDGAAFAFKGERLLHHFPIRFQHPQSISSGDFSGFVEGNPALGAVEQGNAEQVFQFFHRTAQRRLRNVQPRGGARQRAALGERYELFQ